MAEIMTVFIHKL